jgi:hypothetical protein
MQWQQVRWGLNTLTMNGKPIRQNTKESSSDEPVITPGSPWENGYIESFNARLRDKFLNGEIFYTLHEARILIETWRHQYNTIRPHSSVGYRPPAPEVLMWPAPPAAWKGTAGHINTSPKPPRQRFYFIRMRPELPLKLPWPRQLHARW